MQRKTFADEKEGWNASTWAEIDIRSTLDKYINSQTLNNVRGLNAYVRCYEILTKTLTDINAQTYTVTQIAQIMQELGIWNNAVFTEMFSTNSALSQFKLCQLNTANQENITSSIKQNLRGEQRDLAMYFYRIMQQTNRRANYFSIDQQLRKERTKLLEFFTKNKNSPLYLEILAKQYSAVQEKFIDYLLNALEI
jgi:DNA topoisomerase VI subunit B